MSSYKTRARDKGNINNDYTKAVVSGTSSINAESLTALNLLPNLPTKTNGSSILTSSLLEIADINGLGSAIDGFVSYNGTSPAPIGNFTKISDIDGNVENSGITETDITTNTTNIGTNTTNIGLNDTDILNLQNDKVNKTGDTMTGNLDMTGNALFNLRTITGNGVDSVQILNGGQGLEAFVDRARIQSVNNIELSAGVNNVSCESNLDMNNNDLLNINKMNIQNVALTGNTQFISDVSQLPTAIGGFHLLEDNTSYIICGQITLTNGLEYGNNCSVTGIDFSASITFDETLNDIVGFKSVNQNVYLSKLTIFGGGGRFTGNINYSTGLFSCSNIDVVGGFPFYGRSKRFKVDGCNFIKPYVVGQVKGFATLNFNNNLISGTGTFDIYEGLEVIDGLSLEFLGNKIVLFRGGIDANSPAKLLRFGASINVNVIPQKPEGLMGFNAVNVSSNIFHPRGNFENGIDFDPTSRTGLGVISSNTFIRSGGIAPLINYENQVTYDNYNPFSVETYSIVSNVGVVDSEPNLKSIIQLSNSISSTSLTKLVCQDNNQVEPIDESSRFAIKLELTGVSTAFVGNETITDDASGETALILFAESLIATTQIVYITDMSGKFNAIPTTFTGSGVGTSTGGSLFFYWRYSEKDPRKLILTANFDLDVGNNTGFSVAPNMGAVADTLCATSSVSASAGAGSTLSVVCSKKYVEGDYVEFYASSTSGNINLVKAVITIK